MKLGMGVSRDVGEGGGLSELILGGGERGLHRCPVTDVAGHMGDRCTICR